MIKGLIPLLWILTFTESWLALYTVSRVQGTWIRENTIWSLEGNLSIFSTNMRAFDFAVSITTIGVPGASIYFRGSTAPCALVDVTSIGALGPKENEELVEVSTEVICPGLGIDPDRMYICFHDLGTHEIGFKGHTYQKLCQQ